MSNPAKDEADLVQCMAKAMHDSVYGGQRDWMDASKFERLYREMEADAALAAIRAAGWAVVPAILTKNMEYDFFRAENARLREVLVYIGEVCIRHDQGNETGRVLGYIADNAREALDLDGQKERRAKALSDLAEMDADLLDIDPEGKP